MKKILVFAAMAMACTGFAETKVATVNVVDLVKAHPNHEANRTLLKSTADDYRAKMDAKQADAKKIVEEAKKLNEEWQNPMISATKKQELQKKLEGLQQQMMAAQQALRKDDQRYQEDLSDLEARLLKIETGDVRAKIAEWAKANGYDLVIDSTMCGYADPKLDATAQIAKMLTEKKADKAEKKDEGK